MNSASVVSFRGDASGGDQPFSFGGLLSMNQATRAEELESFIEEDHSEPIPPADIISYNELRSCADLYRLHTTGKLEIQPDFQREVVWKKDEQTRFIDSLVKQLPIPSMCFSLDYKTQRWQVIDGLQRMSSIVHFLGNESWKLSNLPDVHASLRGARNVDLRQGGSDSQRLYDLVENVSIPVTVLRCDYSQQSHMRYLFTIFHRLNSGGVRLNNQEIRNCIYSGPFNDLLKGFDREDDDWQIVKGRIWGSMSRYRSVEVLLRMLAFGQCLEKYDGNLARFLNEFMHDEAQKPAIYFNDLPNVLASISKMACAALETQYGKQPLAVVEAVLVALFVNREKLSGSRPVDLRSALNKMLERPPFAEGARYAVSNVENVQGRMRDAIAAFSSVA